MLFVGANGLEKVGAVAAGELDLGEHRVAIEEELCLYPCGDGAQPAGSGDVRQHVGFGEDFVGHFLVGNAMILAIGAIAVDPTVAHVELLHNAAEVIDIMCAVVAALLRHGIVGPVAGVLKVPHVVTERPEPEHVLDIVPCDPAEGVLANEPGDDNAHGVERKGML